MQINKTRQKLVNIIFKYIAIVILPTAVGVTAAITWNNRVNATSETIQEPMEVMSLDKTESIVILEGSKIIRNKLPTKTLLPPAVSTTLAPTIVPTTTNAPQLRARLSHYWPAWGPPNCIGINWDGKTCASLLTDGKQWQHWSYYAERKSTACPKEWKVGTVFRIEGFGDYKCVDRGGAINILPDDTFFLDLMTPHMPYIKGGEVVRDQYSPMGSYVVNVSIVKNY